MISFNQFLTERFVNAIDDRELKEKYKEQVWDLLQFAYRDIGGIKGSGFESPEAMVEKIPFWKMIVKNGVVHGVIMYKDKGGRKSVAIAVDGSDYAIRHMTDALKQDVFRSFGEKSKGALGKIMKTVPWNTLKHYTMTPEEAEKQLGKDLTPVTDVDELPPDAELTLKKYPQLEDYAYIREIGGKPTFKVMFGTGGQTIR